MPPTVLLLCCPVVLTQGMPQTTRCCHAHHTLLSRTVRLVSAAPLTNDASSLPARALSNACKLRCVTPGHTAEAGGGVTPHGANKV